MSNNNEVNNQSQSDSDHEGQTEVTKQPLSRHQKKKLKEKKKKQDAKITDASTVEKKQGNIKETQIGTNNAEESFKNEEDGEKKVEGSKKGDKKKKETKANPAALLARKRMEQMQKLQQQRQRIRKQRQAQDQRIRQQQAEKARKQKEDKDRLLQQEKARLDLLKMQKLYLPPKQQEKLNNARRRFQHTKKQEEIARIISEGRSEQIEQSQRKRFQQQIKRLEEKRLKQQLRDQKLLKDERQDFKSIQGKYRSPVCCILGHVDTGKTTLLDKIRRTNVQESEAGGITQQIGATFFPQSKLIEQVAKCKQIMDIQVPIPGLLIIDTPGHQSFKNLRSRGSSLCDIAILVVDLQQGFEQQTYESLELLRKRRTPFVIALNKIDRSYSWQAFKNGSSYNSLKNQKPEAFQDYSTKLDRVKLQLNEKGYNAALYWQNQQPDEYISLVPTSGITGQGIPDLLSMIVLNCLTNEQTAQRIEIKKNWFKCTVMEVKMTEGYGTTIDCLLIDGAIKKEDQIVVLGFTGPIVTKVKAILTPHPMKQMRVKDEYIHHDIIYAANGVKIAANGLDQAVAGSPLIVANTEQELHEAKITVNEELGTIKKKFKLHPVGVGVSASTLGSLQALLQYLKSQKIPVSYVSVGPISKDDVIKAMKSLLSESPQKRKQEYACLLAFDVKILGDAVKFAQQKNIKIFTADIIYHLTGLFTQHVQNVRQARRQKQGKDAVFPCILKQVQVFRKSNPIVLGVDVEQGILKIGTPISVYNPEEPDQQPIKLGYVESIEHQHKKITEARKNNGSIAICIAGQSNIMAGRHFQLQDKLASILSRRSIDVLEEHYEEQLGKDDRELMKELRKYYGVK